MRNQLGLNTALIDTKKNLNDDLDLQHSSSIRLIEYPLLRRGEHTKTISSNGSIQEHQAIIKPAFLNSKKVDETGKVLNEKDLKEEPVMPKVQTLTVVELKSKIEPEPQKQVSAN